LTLWNLNASCCERPSGAACNVFAERAQGYGINDFSVKDTGVLMAATAAKTWNLLGKANDQTALQVAGAKTLARYGFCTQTPSATVRRILWGLRCAIAPP